jgi:O-antigen biosynthesis protein
MSRHEIERLNREIDRLRSRVQKLEADRQRLLDRYERLQRRRAVRIALSLADSLGSVSRRVRGGAKAVPGPGDAGERPAPKPEVVRRQVLEALRAKSQPRPTSGPLVSIITPTHDGAEDIERLLEALARNTSYRSFEMIVIDNASSDHTADVLARPWGFPVEVISNTQNESFSRACNQGAEAANGELLLFLNNDVEPATPEWLGALVAEATATEHYGVTGAILLYPPEHENAAAPMAVQHAGIGFRHRNGGIFPFNVGGGDPTAFGEPGHHRVPAATAACLLVPSSDFEAIDGFDEQYVYGFEDVDLCLRLGEHGSAISVVHDAVLIHNESKTQRRTPSTRIRANRLRNNQVFAERWTRTLNLVALPDALSEHPWWMPQLSHRVAITVTRDDPAAGWGDWYTAHELGDALAANGWDVIYAEAHRDRWYDLPDDVAMIIALHDRYDARRAPNDAVKVAWIRNWTDRWISQEWFASYDVVLPSSRISADVVRRAGVNPPGIVPIATNPARFHRRPTNPSFQADYTFTGNHWGVGRDVIDILDVSPDEQFTIFGRGWGDVPRVSRYWRGELPYDELADLYSSVKIVLDDTAGPTLPYGAVNSRVFDALACGALVVSNNVEGSRELFDGLLPTYSNRHELRAHLDRLLHDDVARKDLTDQLTQRVLDHHTYAHRAEQIIELTRAALEAPVCAIKTSVPHREEASQWGDTHFAEALALRLRHRGWTTRIDILPEWDSAAAQNADAVIHLRGLNPYVPKPLQTNLLWVISHPDGVTAVECSRYDVVLVASETYARDLESRIDVPVHTLLQATDTDRFRPLEPDPTLRSEVLFVGNSRNEDRPAVRWAVDAEVPLTVYGSGWEDLIPDELVKGHYFPNEDLAQLYSSAAIVLNDQWTDMAESGFLPNRLFDALACGALVISTPIAGLDDVFDGLIPSFGSPAELEVLVQRYLSDPMERQEVSRRGTELVRRLHSFTTRAEFIDSLLRQRTTDLGSALRQVTPEPVPRVPD